MRTTSIDLVLSGSGTNASCLQGAVSQLRRDGYRPVRVAGTSGGSIVAAALAYGMTDKQMLDISLELFGGDLLDPSPLALRRGGVHKGDVIHRLLRKHFPGTMDQKFAMPWGAFAVNLNRRVPYFFASHDVDPGRTSPGVVAECGSAVPVADVLRASISIPFFFAAAKIHGHPKTLWTDGGTQVNLGMGIWDDFPGRTTVGVRFKSYAGKPQPIYGATGVVRATASVLLANIGNTYVSEKHRAEVIDIETDSDSLDFTKDPREVARMLRAGGSAAAKWAYGRP